MRVLTLFAGLLATLLALAGASWGMSQPAIEIGFGDRTLTLSLNELLARADLTEIQVPRDSTYKRPMSYRALPLASLLRGLPVEPGGVIEVSATDGFVTQLPADLVFTQDAKASVPYLAVEPVDAPWPLIPGKTNSAGPFYVVWLNPEASGVRSEQWPYAVASFHGVESPEHRWPAVAVAPKIPADSPIRTGQALFITQCMVCHTLNGAGSAHVGPDLNIPQNPTDYLTPTALHQLIRNPASVRTWPEMRMPGFDQQALSDHEIDLVIGYLAHMAGRKEN